MKLLKAIGITLLILVGLFGLTLLIGYYPKETILVVICAVGFLGLFCMVYDNLDD